MEAFKLKDGTTAIIRKAGKPDAKGMIDYIDKISAQSDFLTFGQGDFAVTLEQEEAFIENVSKQDNGLFIIAEVEGQIIGNLNFSGGPRPRIAHVGEVGISVLQEYWSQGIGTKLMETLIDWAKKSKNIRKINLRVRSDNSGAIHVYKKLGFVEEGHLTRDVLINGTFYDAISMGLEVD